MTDAHQHRRLTPESLRMVQRPPRVRVIQAFEVVFQRGEGCCEKDPAREVTAFYLPNGALIAEHDPFVPEEPSADGS